MGRFLLYFSYIGTRYRGMQRQLHDDGVKSSIQGVLELAVSKLRPRNEAPITTSSRTDKGVHALLNTAHVDLEHVKENHEYDEQFIARQLNNVLLKEGHQILIHKVQRVDAKFHARHDAIGRKYLYRAAMVNKADGELRPMIPIAELDRCHFVKAPLCESTLWKMSRILSGFHDFSSFMCQVPGRIVHPFRAVDVSVSRGRGVIASSESSAYNDVTFFDLHFYSKSFMYKQVRKMVSVMLARARGDLSSCDVRRLLDEPHVDHWPSHVSIVPACGLYLRGVDYDSADLRFNGHDKMGDRVM